MAILKEVENEYGVDFRYHKLREARVTNDDKGVQLVLTVYSWVDKQARIDGKQPCMRQCIINGADFAMNPFYALLKAKFPEFSHGENDFDNDFKGGNVPARPEFFDQTTNGKLFKRWREQGMDEAEPPKAETQPTEIVPLEEITEDQPEPEASEPMDMTKPQDETEESEDLPEENYGKNEEIEIKDEGDKE